MKSNSFPVLGLFVAGMCLISCTFPETLPPVVLPASSQALALSVMGEALVFRNGGWAEILPGDLVNQGDVIRVTARSSLELQFGLNAVLRLQEETLITLNVVEIAKEKSRLETELAGGQILAKVNRLVGGSQLSVRTGTVSMGVRGTEFLVRRRGDRVLAAVGSGKVEIASPQGNLAIVGGQETSTELGSVDPLKTEPLTEAHRESLAAVSQLEFLPFDEETLYLVRFLIRTLPPDADIVMGDRVMGRGTWGGVIKVGNELELRVEKGGYQPQNLTVKAEEGVHPVHVVELSPLSPDQVQAPGLQTKPSAEELLRLQEATLAALRIRTVDIENQLGVSVRREAELQTRVQTLSAEAAELNSRLTQATRERTEAQRQLTDMKLERDRAQRDLEVTRRALAASRTQLDSVMAAREAEQLATNEIIRQLREEAATNPIPAAP